MAIDDNTSYELTGAQVKDLANKIKGKAADNTFVGATSAAPGSKGLVPQPQAGDDTKYLKGDGTWGTVSQHTPTVFYIDKELPYFGSTPFVTDVSVYKDSALTETATLQELYDAMDAGNTALVYDAAMNGAKVYTTLYAFHAPHGGNPDSNGDYLYFAGDDGTVISANPQGFSTNDAAVFNTGVYGLYSVNVMSGATSSVTGAAGLVPAPSAGDQEKVLHGDGTWKNTTAKLVEMSYGESNAWAKFIAAYNAGSIVYCRASSNSNPASGSQTRKAFMAYVNNAASPTNVEFQYVRSMSTKTDSQQSDQVFVYTLTNASGGTWSVATRNMAPKINVNAPITKTFTSGANATLTLGASTMTGATSSAAGATGVVPAPSAGSQDKFLRGDGTWAIPAQAAMSGTWTNTTTLSSTGSVAYTTVDVTSMGFSSKDDYIVVAVNQGGGSNDPFTSITVPDGYKSATSFRIELWNCHWASGAIGAGTKIQWAVFRLN